MVTEYVDVGTEITDSYLLGFMPSEYTAENYDVQYATPFTAEKKTYEILIYVD